MSSFISNSDPSPGGTPGVTPDVWRRFFCLATGTAAAIIGVLFVFVTLADPWDSLPLSPPLPRAPVTASQRFAYPALARSPLFDSAVFGTSTSRLLRPSALNQSFHARFANLAMNDATPWEQTQLMRVFLRAHPTAYLLTHMAIMPLIDTYTTGLDWLAVGRRPPSGRRSGARLRAGSYQGAQADHDSQSPSRAASSTAASRN